MGVDELNIRSHFEAALSPGVEYDEREVALLALAEKQWKDMTQLEALLEASDYLIPGSKGQMRLNPLVSELRLARAAIARILGEIRLPYESEGVSKSVRHQRAARRRWDRNGSE